VQAWGIDPQHIATHPSEHRISRMRPCVTLHQDTGDRDTRPNGRTMSGFATQTSDQVNDDFSVSEIDSGFGAGDLHFRLAIVMADVYRDHAIHQGVLRFVDATYSSGLEVNMARKSGWTSIKAPPL
jgi:hypothetical protein